MSTEEQRTPLLSDDALSAMMKPRDEYTAAWLGGDKVRDFYEAKITSGELRVVKTVRPNWNMDADGKWGSWECLHCRQVWYSHDTPDPGEFCKCGAKIVEP